MRKLLLSLGAMALLSGVAAAQQQVADPLVDLTVAHPAYAQSAGPRVVIDGAHNNFHTVDGRYAPFAQLLRNDGFVVDGSTAAFTDASLASVKVLVIANAIATANATPVENGGTGWALPTPSAFTPDEIAAVHRWVEGGGSLFLIVDHMPMSGNAHDLAASFGVQFENGFAFSTRPGSGPQHPDLFTRENGGLVDSSIYANVHQVRTFTGSAFSASGANVHPVLRLNEHWTVLEPTVAWQFDANTPTVSGADKLQGALIEVGRGRVAVFGEAAMFTAQVAGPNQTPMGLRAPGAEENKQFALDIVHWLART